LKVLPIHGNEDWICDRYADEWMNYNLSHASPYNNTNEADVLWLLAPWEWKNIPEGYLKNKKVVCTIHHMVPEKTDESTWQDFKLRDQYVDAYHTSSEISWNQFKDHTNNKPYLIHPFWGNPSAFRPFNKSALSKVRYEYGIGADSYVVGSFQRDTEGHDLASPKLEKGPDVLCDILEKLNEKKPNLEVLLAGWRRQYVIGRLEQAGIKYNYINRPDTGVINELYNALDLYIVASRYEGAPQALYECIMTKTPVVSTRVGLAEKFLHPDSLFSDKKDFFNAKSNDNHLNYSAEVLEQYLMPQGFTKFNSFFDSL
jgi:glycosyltransferase involved in cell wall biosynthesis